MSNKATVGDGKKEGIAKSETVIRPPVNPSLKVQLEKDLGKVLSSLPPLAHIIGVDPVDPGGLLALLNHLTALLPDPVGKEVNINPALAAQRRRLLAHQEVERVYSRDIANANGNKVGFLGLPAEIRNQIYRLCLVFPGGECQFDKLTPSGYGDRYQNQQKFIIILSNDFKPNISLLQTCSQVCDEAIQILYGENMLSAYRQFPNNWEAFFRTVSANKHLTRRVQLEFNDHDFLPRPLAHFSNSTILDKVEVRFTSWSIYSRKYNPAKLSRKLQNFCSQQLALRMAQARCVSQEGEESFDEGMQRKLEAMKVLQVFQLGSMAKDELRNPPRREEYVRLDRITDPIYDRIAVGLGLIQKGETLETLAKTSKEIRGWKQGSSEVRRKRLVGLSFGAAATRPVQPGEWEEYADQEAKRAEEHANDPNWFEPSDGERSSDDGQWPVEMDLSGYGDGEGTLSEEDDY